MVARLIESTSNENAMHDVARFYLKNSDAARVLIVQERNDIERWRRFFADNYAQLSFDMKVMALKDYVVEKWTLFGDGRQMVGDIPVEVLLNKVLSGASGLPPRKKSSLARSERIDSSENHAEDSCSDTSENIQPEISYPESSQPESIQPKSSQPKSSYGLPNGLSASVGTVQLLRDVVTNGFGVPAFEDAIAEGHMRDNLGVVDVLKRFKRELKSYGLVTYGEALSELSRILPRVGSCAVAGFGDFRPCEVEFFEERGDTVFFVGCPNGAASAHTSNVESLFAGSHQTGEEDPSSSDGSTGQNDRAVAREIQELGQALYNSNSDSSSVTPTGAVRFAFPSGIYAEKEIIPNIVEHRVSQGVQPSRIYVSNDAFSNDLDCQYRLASRGIGSAGWYRQKIYETSFGKALCNLVLQEDGGSLTDFCLSRYSGLSRADAYEFDKMWRSRKSLPRENLLDWICEKSEASKSIVNALKNGDYGSAVISMMNASSRAVSFIGTLDDALSHKAADKVLATLDCCNAFGADSVACINLAINMSVSARYEILPLSNSGGIDTKVSSGETNEIGDANTIYGVNEPHDAMELVEFGSLANVGKSNWDTVILTGLTAGNYPVMHDPSLSVSLLSKMGVGMLDDFLEQRRFDFYSAVASANNMLVLERALNDSDGNPERPSVLLEELVDCYRDNLEDFDDMDSDMLVPKKFKDIEFEDGPMVESNGEDSLDVVMGCGIPLASTSALPSYAENLPVSARKSVIELGVGPEGSPREISPTYIEAYMDCPYKWFIARKLSPESLDIEFDARATGSLMHGILKNYYDSISQNGNSPRRVSFDLDIPFIREKVDKCCDEFISESIEGDDCSPYSRLSAIEQKTVDECKRNARDLLEDDVAFLNGFVPTMFEKNFGDESAFMYAGHPFHGTIDRVDVDQDGRAVVIDYKGSLSGGGFGYKPPKDGGTIQPGRIQVLMYATMVKRCFGLDVVGAVYRSYKNRREVAGAFDIANVGAVQVFGSKNVFEMSKGDFSSLLDATEERVALALDKMGSGDISPNPAGSYACEYCPVTSCSRRM